jgi:hypothetical protein
VTANAICVATDVSRASSTAVSVSSSLLTITGTGTDTINYICF